MAILERHQHNWQVQFHYRWNRRKYYKIDPITLTMVKTGFDVLFFFILIFSSFSHGHINYVIIFLKGLKSTVDMIHIKPANQTEAALLWCRRHVLLGNLLKQSASWKWREIFPPLETSLVSLSWVHYSLLHIPPARCSTTVIPANIFLHSNSRFEYRIFPLQFQAPPGPGRQCIDACGPTTVSHMLSVSRFLGWMRSVLPANSPEYFTEIWILVNPTGGAHHVHQRSQTLVWLGATPTPTFSNVTLTVAQADPAWEWRRRHAPSNRVSPLGLTSWWCISNNGGGYRTIRFLLYNFHMFLHVFCMIQWSLKPLKYFRRLFPLI